MPAPKRAGKVLQDACARRRPSAPATHGQAVSRVYTHYQEKALWYCTTTHRSRAKRCRVEGMLLLIEIEATGKVPKVNRCSGLLKEL